MNHQEEIIQSENKTKAIVEKAQELKSLLTEFHKDHTDKHLTHRTNIEEIIDTLRDTLYASQPLMDSLFNKYGYISHTLLITTPLDTIVKINGGSLTDQQRELLPSLTQRLVNRLIIEKSQAQEDDISVNIDMIEEEGGEEKIESITIKMVNCDYVQDTEDLIEFLLSEGFKDFEMEHYHKEANITIKNYPKAA